MNLDIGEEQRQLQDAIRKLFEKEATQPRIRAAETTGIDRELWAHVVAMGAPLLRVREAAGGLGVGLFEAVLVAELAGRFMAPVPLLEAITAAGVLSSIGNTAAQTWLSHLADGSKIVTLALQDVGSTPCQLVPAGAIADAVLCLDGDVLVLVTAEARRDSVPGEFGVLPVAAWDLAVHPPIQSRTVLARGPAARAAFLAAVDEFKLLVAALLAGLSRQSLDEAAAYSRERPAFDRPIGSFQGLAHPMADAVTDVDGARLLVWRAVTELGRHRGATVFVSMAFWWSTRAAATATVLAMRVFGGYGMAIEYPAQLYFRRSRAWTLIGGDPQQVLDDVGARSWGEPSERVSVDAGRVPIDFGFGEVADRFAETARTFFAAEMSPELHQFAFNTTDGYRPEFQMKLAEAGLLYPHWPRQHGGADRSPYEAAALREVFAEVGWPKVLPTVTDMVGQILMRFAGDEARQEILPRLASGAANCALGYSEPSCGSDIFAAKTRAVRDDDGWIIDGQKMWTSQGHIAQYVLLIARTDMTVAKHAGVTLFILPVPTAGFSVQEIKTLGNERTNITYYAGVRVHDRYRVGEINGGAKVLSAALTLEQSGGDFFVGALQSLLRHAVAWAQTAGVSGAIPMDDASVRARLAAVAVRMYVADVLDRRCLWAGAVNQRRREYGPMAKLFASEALVSCSLDLAELTAPWSIRVCMDDVGAIELESRKAIQATIYGGTSEIQRSIIAETALGMPRTRS